MRFIPALLCMLLTVGPAFGQAPYADLQPADPGPLVGFGESVAVSGSFMVVGDAAGSPEGFLGAGAAYVYQKQNGSWRELGQLRPLDRSAGDSYGRSVAIEGSTAVVGAPDNRLSAGVIGAAYIFERVDGIWRQVQQLRPSYDLQDDGFGGSVAVSGTLAAVTTERGTVYIYQRQGDGSWLQRVRSNYPGYGRSNVSVLGSSVVTSFWGKGILILDRGSGLWTQTAFLEVPLVCGVASGSLAVAAGQDRAVMYQRQGAGWAPIQDIAPPAGSEFGFGCALQDGSLMLLAGGGAAVYHRGTGGWIFETMLTAPSGTAPGVEGHPLAFDGSNRVMGVNRDRRVYLFGGTSTVVEDRPDGSYSLEAFPNPSSGSVTVRHRPRNSGPVRSRLVDLLGREVSLLYSGHAAAGKPLEWLVTGLRPGIWLVTIESADGRLTLPLASVR